MKILRLLLFSILFIVTTSIPCSAQERKVFLREDFVNMDDWKPLYFPKIKKHTEYSIETSGEESFLRSSSDSSASGIIFKRNFNVYEYPKVRWRWKVSNIYAKGNAKEKSGDDYPLRIYIIFKYDSETSSIGKRFKYGLAKKIYGEYPPDSSLNYIWANKTHKERIITNTYAKEAQMIVLQSGPQNVGLWQIEEVDVLEDYRKVFGKDPPDTASIAVMNDADNTGESAVSYLDFIEILE